MKIKKISKIDNVYSYSFYEWDKINLITFNDKDGNSQTHDGHFNEKNIIFAENANGKSMLVNIFKSLNGHNIPLEKHRDRKTEGQEVSLILDNDAVINNTGSAWSSQDLKNKFVIFDKHYIDEYVHSMGPDETDTPKRRQQRGRNIIYLGNFAGYNDEIERINTLKNTIAEKNEEYNIIEDAKIITLLTPHNMITKEIVDKKQDILNLNEADIEKKKEELIKHQADLQKTEKAILEKAKIASLSLLAGSGNLSSLTVKIFDNGKEKEITINPKDLFSFTVAKGVQQTLSKIANKKDFVQHGLALLTDNPSECPFCEQKIMNGDYIKIIKEYQAIFDKNFADEEQSIRSLLVKYKAILENLRDLSVPSNNQARFDQASSFVAINETIPQITLDENEKKIIKAEIELAINKDKKMLDAINGSQIDSIEKIIDSAKAKIKEYNDTIARINEKIEILKKDALEGKLETNRQNIQAQVTKLKHELFFIENKASFIKYYEALDKNTNNNKIVESLERIYQALKNKIVEEYKTFVNDYFQLIKTYVKEISPSMDIFEICGEANIDRRNLQDPVQCGFHVTYNNEDCTSGLSEGEKQVIALSFFFAHLNKETDKDKIVILDDPITSFDAGKRKSTAEIIQRETQTYSQLFVFTCDPLFREYCLKQFPNKRNFYYIFKTRSSSAIHYVPNNRETIYSSFENEFKNIESVDGTNENVVIYGQKLRFCLETKIKEDYFGYSEDNLSSMIHKVTGRNKQEFDKLFEHKDIILQIYSYCNTGGLAHYPRDGATSWNELKDKINQYLALAL